MKLIYKKDLDCANSGNLSKILGPNNKSFQAFHPWTPLRGFRVIGWLAYWIRVSPAFYFQKLASLYFWAWKVGILRWLVTDQHVLYLIKFPQNVNQSLACWKIYWQKQYFLMLFHYHILWWYLKRKLVLNEITGLWNSLFEVLPEAATQRYSWKYAKNLHENTHAEVRF